VESARAADRREEVLGRLRRLLLLAKANADAVDVVVVVEEHARRNNPTALTDINRSIAEGGPSR
jgi:hypothetical protein